MDITFLFKGFVIGFSIAAPVGLIGVLCIRRTLADGRLSGIASGLEAEALILEKEKDISLWKDGIIS